MSLEIRSSASTYPVYLDEPEAARGVLGDGARVFIADKKVWHLHKDGPLRGVDENRSILLEASERRKEFSRLGAVYRRALALGARKNVTIVAIGGGVIQDVAGFVASTLFRGLPWAFFPTTLLAQADSCIGAKSSINLGSMKNQIGTFYPPIAVHVCPAFLRTLARGDINSGLGEIVKLAIIDGDGRLGELLRALPALLARDEASIGEWVGISLGIKKKYIEEDEFDRGIRNYLNFGHCFGHAIESATGNRVPHGQAVSLGILLADIVSRNRGLSAPERVEAHREAIARIVDFRLGGLRLDEGRMLRAMGADKKRTGKGYAVVVSLDGDRMLKLDDVDAAEVRLALKEAKGL